MYHQSGQKGHVPHNDPGERIQPHHFRSEDGHKATAKKHYDESPAYVDHLTNLNNVGTGEPYADKDSLEYHTQKKKLDGSDMYKPINHFESAGTG